ncbi:hypothetical protein BOX15_Mlig031270g1, partial [Macrostomum lignano]
GRNLKARILAAFCNSSRTKLNAKQLTSMSNSDSDCSCTSSCCERHHGKRQTVIRFDGSSAETVAYANTFWQSAQMVPTLESGLSCPSVSQRLKRAPPGYQPVSISCPNTELSPKQEEFLQRVRDEEELDRFTRLQLSKDRQDEQRSRFQKQRVANQTRAEQLAQLPKDRLRRTS